ncbi:amino acid ABC transporter permease [Tabrizicola soli]|uniref:Amino acid ABC transporter permease n=1 Tax=Tabrizicola soli TaxID=2185115 RepID=A0ABV7DV01_9RHOB|nr:amino acid ABC transporter permease [Tabrizicola soli]
MTELLHPRPADPAMPAIKGHLPVLLPVRPPRPVTAAELFTPGTALLLLVLLAWFSVGPVVAQAAGETRTPVALLLLKWTPVLAEGFAFNILISILSMLAGTVLGVGLGVLQVSPNRLLARLAWVVTQFFRNSPWLVLLFYCILLIPFELEILGTTVPFPGWIKAVIGLSLPVMAYMSEFMRGAIQSIPSGQWESAASLGFTRRQTMIEVILPQTVTRVLPSWMNLYAVLTMATPIVSIVGVNEVMALTRAALSSESRTDLLIPMYLYILGWFFLYCYPISRLTRRLERKYAVKL